MATVYNETLDAFDVSAQNIFAAWLFATTSLLGVGGNLLVIAAVALSQQLQTSTNIFVVALSIIDLFTCLLLPVQVVSLVWVGGTVSFALVCEITAVCISIFLGVSVSILTLIAFNRFYMITKERMDYNRLYTKRNTVAMIVAVFSIISVFNVLLAVTGLARFGYDEGICSHAEGNAYSYPAGAWLQLSLIIIVICYIKIYRHVKRHLRSVAPNDQEEAPPAEVALEEATRVEHPHTTDARPRRVRASFGQRQRELESKITTNMLIVIVLFFLCVSPSIAILFVPGDHGVSAVIVAIIAFNSCLNPLVYAWKHPVFKHVFKCILKRRVNQIKEPTQWARSLVATNS